MVGFNFAPRGWASCDGQLLPINQHNALFSLLGTIYGGDGRTTFALPDLRSRVPVHDGRGPGLSNYPIGARGGAETHVMTVNEMPSHGHTATLHAEANIADTANPSDRLLGISGQDSIYAPAVAADEIAMHPDSVSVANAGGNQPFNIRQPFLAVKFAIALVGVYPSRN